MTTDASTTDDTTTDDDATDDAEPAPTPACGSASSSQPLVDDGTLTSEQADTVAAFLVENRPERRPRRLPGRSRRHGGTAVSGSKRGEIADLFGLEPDDLRDLLRDGQSLADIATSHGVDVQTVIDTLVNAAKDAPR